MPGPTSTTTPAPSWPKITGKRPSGSPPERVNSSVWQTPDALISTSTSPNFGPSRSTISISRFFPASKQTAAFVFTLRSLNSWPKPRAARMPALADVLDARRQAVQFFRTARRHQHAGADVDPHHAETGVGLELKAHAFLEDEVAAADAGPGR